MIKILGASLIFLGCTGYGFYMAASSLREVKTLRQLSAVIRYMHRELRFKLAPLPDLCRSAAAETSGILRSVFMDLAAELDRQVSPDPKTCMYAALSRFSSVPPVSALCLEELGASLGRFDLMGQLEALDAVGKCCDANLEKLKDGQDLRLRTYRTLGICCGAALVILFI